MITQQYGLKYNSTNFIATSSTTAMIIGQTTATDRLVVLTIFIIAKIKLNEFCFTMCLK